MRDAKNTIPDCVSVLTPNGKKHAHGKTEWTNELCRDGIRLLMQHYSVVIASICLHLLREFFDAFYTRRPDDVFIFHRLYLSLSIRIFVCRRAPRPWALAADVDLFFHSHSSPMPVVFVAMQLSFMRRRVRHSSISFLTPRKYTSTHESSRRNTNCAASPSNPSPTNKVKVLRHDFRSVLLYDSWLFLVWSFSRARRLRCHLVIAESCVYNWVYAWNLMENW